MLVDKLGTGLLDDVTYQISRLLAFTSLVRPHPEYSISGGDPYLKPDILAIEKNHRKGARFFTNNYSYRNCVTFTLDTLDDHHYKNDGEAKG